MRFPIKATLLAACIFPLGAVRPARAQSYTFQVAECGEYGIEPSGMDNQGVIAGTASTLGSEYALGFLYADGTCKTVAPAHGGISFTGVGADGGLLGLYSAGIGQGPIQSFLLAHGTISPLPSYPGSDSTAYCCLNPSTGVVAGNYDLVGDSAQYGFFYENGTFKPLPSSEYHYALQIAGMNSGGVAVGTAFSAHLYGFTYVGGELHLLQYPGATETTFNGISDNGLIVGTIILPGTAGICTYDLNTGVWTKLNFGPYVSSLPVGINDAGVIAAELSPSGGLLIATPKK